MEIEAVPALLNLAPVETELFLGLLHVAEEPLARLASIARLDTDQAQAALAGLRDKGLVTDDASRCPATYRLQSFAPGSPLADDVRARARAQLDRVDLELELINEVRERRQQRFINVISIRARFGEPPPAPAVSEYLRALYPYLDLRLGTRCNFNCRYCLVGDEKRMTRPVADVLHELELGRRCGLLRVALTGGEPMLHPGLLEIVGQARELGYRKVILVTNASLLAEPSNLRRLRSAGVDAFGFSFDAPDPELAEYLWRNPAYAEVVRGIEHLMAEPDVMLGSIAVITRPTLGALPELARFLADVAASRRGRFLPNLDFVMPEENAWNERHDLVPRLSEAVPAVREALEIAASRGLTLTYRGLPACVMGDARLDRDMERFMSIFQVHEVGERVAFNRTALDLFRTKSPRCAECAHDRRCPGVFRSYAHLYGFDELQPIAGRQA